MPIPESQLDTWSRQGSIDLSKRTHETIRYALKEWEDLRNRDYEVYLQGSYKNSTNISGSSDVDVIAQMNDTFSWNKQELPIDQQEAASRAYAPASHRLADFRQAVLAALQNHFGHSVVTEGDKAIKIKRGSNRLPADVVVCQQYRQFQHFHSLTDHSVVEGIKFFTQRDGRKVINYPKPHYKHGVSKNDGCTVSYKGGVRVFKNARNAIVRRGWMPSSAVPSYFLECFAYNASNHCYSGSWQNLYQSALTDFANGNYPEFLCQNRVRLLFGKSYDQWNIPSAVHLVEALVRLWDEWR